MSEVNELQFGESTLAAVPAVHFRMAFAESVNRLCHTRDNLPDAIAVELGPQAAAAVRQCLLDIGIGGRRRRLPLMLALIRQNRHVHPAVREAALALQRDTGRPLEELEELPDRNLKELLDYSPVRVLYLSAVDSIIEAVRCSIELNIPLYGVDLEEFATARRKEFMIQDPMLACGRVDDYVGRNLALAHSHRDELIDGRRETAMAARLKTVLARHRRVVLTCGLAHWQSLQELLSRQELAAAPIAPAGDTRDSAYSRTVVHPALAIYHVDAFPAVVDRYEMHRLSEPSSGAATYDNRVDVHRLFLDVLRRGYESNLRKQIGNNQLDRFAEDWEARHDFEQLTANLALLSNRHVPDMMTVLSAAEGCLSKPFCQTIGEIFMEADWVSPNEFPDLDVLLSAERRTGRCISAQLVNQNGKRSRRFYIDPLPDHEGGSYTVHIPIPTAWTVRCSEPGGAKGTQKGETSEQDWPSPPVPLPPNPPPDGLVIRSWPPVDFLTTALTLRAATLTRSNTHKELVERFEGSFLDGVHMKATQRAFISGDDHIYVRERRRITQKNASRSSDGWPIVWLFRLDADRDCIWNLWSDRLRRLLPLAKDKIELERLDRAGRIHMVEAVAYCKDGTMTKVGNYDVGKWNIKEYNLAGVLLYLPGHLGRIDLQQVAAWAERTKCRRNPWLGWSDYDINGVVRAAGLKAPESDWASTMVQAAIPYAETSVTVVAPDHFSLPPSVYALARKHSVEIQILPLSLFPREAVRSISTYYVVPVTQGADKRIEYPDFLTELFDAEPDKYQKLVPKEWLDYGL